MSSTRIASEDVVIQAPMSFVGSAKRIARIKQPDSGVGTQVVVILATAVAWTAIVAWYSVMLTVLLIPFLIFRAFRRSDRKAKRQQLQHQETLAAMQSQSQSVELTVVDN